MKAEFLRLFQDFEPVARFMLHAVSRLPLNNRSVDIYKHESTLNGDQ